MKQLSTSRTLCVFRHGPSLLALSPNKFLLLASSGTLFITFFRTSQLPGASCHLLCSAASPQHTPTSSLPPFNLQRARVRRNRGRLPSSRCIESAQTRHARAPTLFHRASDTTLRLIVTDRPNRGNFRFADHPPGITRFLSMTPISSTICSMSS